MTNREQYLTLLRDRLLKLEFHEHESSATSLLIKRIEGITDKEYDDKYHLMQEQISLQHEYSLKFLMK